MGPVLSPGSRGALHSNRSPLAVPLWELSKKKKKSGRRHGRVGGTRSSEGRGR